MNKSYASAVNILSVDHDIRRLMLVLLGLLLWDRLLGCGHLASFTHFLVCLLLALNLSFAFLFLLILVFTAAAFGLKVFTASIRGLVHLLAGAVGLFYASHLGILSLLDLGALNLSLDSLFFLFFFSAILGTIVLGSVGLRLLRRELCWCTLFRVPLDGKSCNAWLLCQDVALDLLDDGLRRGFRVESLVGVLVVNVVTHTNELSAVIAAAEEDDRHAQDLAVGDPGEVWRVRLEDKLVDAYWNGTNEERVKLLVVLRSVDS